MGAGKSRRTDTEIKAAAEHWIAQGFTLEAAAAKVGVGRTRLYKAGVRARKKGTSRVDPVHLTDADAATAVEVATGRRSVQHADIELSAPLDVGAPDSIGGATTVALARQVADASPFAGTEIRAQNLIHDAAMCALLGRLVTNEAPAGVASQGVKNLRQRTGAVIGRLLFTGGTALAMCHGVTKRYSEDVDFVMLPDPDFEVNPSSKRRVRKLVLDAAKHSISAAPVHLGPEGLDRRLSLSTVKYPPGVNLSLDVAWRDDFVGHEELLGASTQPATSMLERFADAEHLPSAARGPHAVPCVSVAYIATTKLDAQHLRAVQGRYKEMGNRVRDLYDLAMISLSDKADQVRNAVPHIAELVVQDTIRNNGQFPRPATGYANSPAFQPDLDGMGLVRTAYERMQSLVYGTQVTFDDALELIRELDPR